MTADTLLPTSGMTVLFTPSHWVYPADHLQSELRDQRNHRLATRSEVPLANHLVRNSVWNPGDSFEQPSAISAGILSYAARACIDGGGS
jgi:hypothetical protein